MEWTLDQQNAIKARGGTLLVSAAAGSGKTAVLVERVIRRLTDKVNPCGVRQLLIVTFTNAAAAQMKEKISAAITKQILLEPSNKYLRRQQMLLPLASICTIDSFCINLVRENFLALDVAPDFRLLDAQRLDVLSNEALDTVVSALYDESSTAFQRLCSLISDYRDDTMLTKIIKDLHITSQAYPYPEKWLDSLVADFIDPKPIRESVWGREILTFIRKNLDYLEECTKVALGIVADDDELRDRLTENFEDDIKLINRLRDAVNTLGWDELIEKFDDESKAFKRLNPVRGYTGENKDRCSEYRKLVKKDINDILGLFVVTEAEYNEDTQSLQEVVSELVNAVKQYAEEFDKLKKAENGADFSDILHLTLKLLQDENGEKTELAKELSLGYAEILVDEYQDVNEAQDCIFKALSDDEKNLFMVGDVKQSIYRFRQAMPEIFLRRREKLPRYNGSCPATITLGKNFRSRQGVTDTVNFIFSQAMSVEAGGLVYDDNERLVYGAEYPARDEADAELHIIEAADGAIKGDLIQIQAVYVADYIENAINSGMLIQNGEERRQATYKDFCIMLREVANSGEFFLQEFASRGIPVYCDKDENFFKSPEIGFMLSLLRVLDNPVDDISLLTVMLSPVFGFTPDDLALMRSKSRRGTIYHCAVVNAKDGNIKCKQFLERLSYLHDIASTVSAGELVRRLIDETGYGAIVGVMQDSEKRKTNLHLLVECVKNYEKYACSGLSGFIRYADSLSAINGGKVSGAKVSENTDAVRITTIHKSKGLEFPVCFLACCESEIRSPKRGEFVTARVCGIGIRSSDKSGLRKYETLNSTAARLETIRENHSDEMRLLYVALTRAKEKIIMLSASNDVAKSLVSSTYLFDSKGLNPFAVSQSKNFADIIYAALLRHPDAHALRTLCAVGSDKVLPCAGRLTVKIVKGYEKQEIVEQAAEPEQADAALIEEVEQRLKYKYPYASLDSVVAKRIASKLNINKFDSTWFASEIPAFMSRGELTPAQRGTATHRFMQFADYDAASLSVEVEIGRLKENGYINFLEAQSVERDKVKAFFEGPLAARIAKAEKVYREYAFKLNVPVREMYSGIDDCAANESLMIEGVVDCAFIEGGEIVIVDYKTDRSVTANELAERYSDQLGIYRRALSQVLGLPTKQAYIYSFELGESIEIK